MEILLLILFLNVFPLLVLLIMSPSIGKTGWGGVDD